ncbi:MAG: excisionase family DNA-binding protein [Caulobacteraceae bacterium]
MARDPSKARTRPVPEGAEETEALLNAELRRRGMSEAEIKAALKKKKKRRKVLAFEAVTHPARAMRPTAAPSRPSEELCTVEFAAGQLKLHVKTVLRFIHEGRLRATRVGKSYRILRADLDAFAGLPARVEKPVEAAWMTSIIDIPGVGAELAQRWATTVTSALNAKPRDGGAMRAEVIYEPDRSHLKIVVVGPPGDSVNMLSLIRAWLEQLQA